MKNVLNHDIPFQRYFEEITRIPHGSFNEKGIADYLQGFAQKNGLDLYRDEANNCIIKKNGMGKGEKAEPIIVQAHTDMVCVKTQDSTHNFETDALPIYIDGDKVKSKGTTLGGDDGTGVATILALLTDDFEHPPIEAVFTVQEEVGMFGAKALDYSRLKAKRYISLDGGGENESSVNAAGCETMFFENKFKLDKATGDVVTVNMKGLAGGHSGACIGLEYGNALKLMASALLQLTKSGVKYKIASITGGQATNAIPDACTATLITGDANAVRENLENVEKLLKTTLFDADKEFAVEVESRSGAEDALSESDSEMLVKYICALPNGVQRKSMDVKDFVTASINVAKIEMNDGVIKLFVSARGASEFILDELEDKMMLISSAFNFKGEMIERTPCWEYNPNSKLRKTASELMEKEWGVKLVEEFTHSGLECGYFAKNIKGLDMFSIGATWCDIHTPNEWMSLSSADKVYAYLKKLLTEII